MQPHGPSEASSYLAQVPKKQMSGSHEGPVWYCPGACKHPVPLHNVGNVSSGAVQFLRAPLSLLSRFPTYFLFFWQHLNSSSEGGLVPHFRFRHNSVPN